MRLLVCFVLFAYSGFAQQHQKFIEVTGFSENEILADYLEVSITVRENDNVKKESEFDLREKEVLLAIEKLGIPPEDVNVDNFSAYRMGISNASKRYSLSKIFLVKVRKMESISQFISKIFEAGANEVRITRRVKTDLENYKREAVKKAVDHARLRGAEIAATLNVKLGQAIQVEELPTQSIPRYDNNLYRYNAPFSTGAVHRGMEEQNESAADSDEDIRKMKVSYRVLIRFEIAN